MQRVTAILVTTLEHTASQNANLAVVVQLKDGN